MNNFRSKQKRLAKAVWVLAKSGAFKTSDGPATLRLIHKARRNMEYFAAIKEMNEC